MAVKPTATKRAIVNSGDVFAEPLPDGRYGAVRVLRREGRCLVIATTPYLGPEVPRIDDPLLSQVLTQFRFRYSGHRAVKWVTGNPPKEYVLVGNVPVSEQDAAIKCDVTSGTWRRGLAHPVYWEWRWAHDHEAFVAEQAREEAALRKRLNTPKPKARMSDEAFWGIIALFDWSCAGDDEAVIRPAVGALAAIAVRDINRFEEALAYKLYQIDTREHERAASGGGPGSSDGFLYARCAMVAAGRDLYEAALRDPARMAEAGDFEPLLIVASEAYTLKTSRDFNYSAGYDYETGSNREGWKPSS